MGALEAARQAVTNPLLNLSIRGAKGVLFSVKGGDELTLGGVNAAGELINSAVDKNASIFFGMSIDPSLGDMVKLTLIATGLKQDKGFNSFTGKFKGLFPGFEMKVKAPGIMGRGKKKKKRSSQYEWDDNF